ncbi:oligosaccharide flippase family protein [Xenorhabdus bovienii]|uniref:oligosaccharide flippase family protein n=1 Tax=Xenorhabdus bovienii TaxID=40576 RepID=UPI00237CC9E9|nr:oligosaccharide flippase family protein [Xenorhabdus bovienii]MDE1493760.1 oligosaccharide flippase family protein [Xenorhabdus bovienii]
MFKIGSNLTIIKNFSYLSFIQILTLLVPFIYYPYLIRKFSIEQYGLVIFIQSIIMIFSIIVDFGFNIYGTKLVSENRENKNRIDEIYTNIFFTKLILIIICFFIFSLFICTNDILRNNLSISILLYFILFGEIFSPQWLFQGLEKIKLAAIINFISKIFLLLFIFSGTNTNLGFYAFPLSLALSSIMNGLGSYFVIKHKLNIKIVKTSLNSIQFYIKESYSFLLSRAAGSIIIRLNTYLLGNYVGFSQVAYYDLAEKIINLLTIPINMLNQVIYPHIARNKKYIIAFTLIKFLLPLYILVYLLCWFFGEKCIILFAGSNMIPAFNVLLILYITLFFNIISYFLGNCVLVVHGKKDDFNNSTYWGLLIYCFSLFIIYNFLGINIINSSWLIVLNSFVVCIYRIKKVILYKHQLV